MPRHAGFIASVPCPEGAPTSQAHPTDAREREARVTRGQAARDTIAYALHTATAENLAWNCAMVSRSRPSEPLESYE